jgi:Trk-type K+ transport system membrane component
MTSPWDHDVTNATTVIVFFASIGGCGFPVVAKKVKWMKIPPKIFFFCKHFGTGVLIATAFVHVSTLSVSYITTRDIRPWPTLLVERSITLIRTASAHRLRFA